jgi:C-terminal processing protease CtpA/Prc
LNDAQKDQVYSALCQAQVNEQDPTWIKNNVTNPTDPTAILDAQEKAKEDALSKVLTPDQLATFRQQMQSQLSMQKAMMQKMSPPTAAVVPATEAHP